MDAAFIEKTLLVDTNFNHYYYILLSIKYNIFFSFVNLVTLSYPYVLKKLKASLHIANIVTANYTISQVSVLSKPIPRMNSYIISQKPIILSRSIACGGTLQYCGHSTCPDNTLSSFYENYLESIKIPIYTAENPRRSKRVAAKTKVEYFTKEELAADEQDEIAQAILDICDKKGLEYNDDLVTEFEDWLPTAPLYAIQKYIWRTIKVEPRRKIETAKYWAKYNSTTLKKQILQQRQDKASSKAITKYCEKNNIEYSSVMVEKFFQWKADPANKNFTHYTYYERAPTYCVKQWFNTLKKTIVF